MRLWQSMTVSSLIVRVMRTSARMITLTNGQACCAHGNAPWAQRYVHFKDTKLNHMSNSFDGLEPLTRPAAYLVAFLTFPVYLAMGDDVYKACWEFVLFPPMHIIGFMMAVSVLLVRDGANPPKNIKLDRTGKIKNVFALLFHTIGVLALPMFVFVWWGDFIILFYGAYACIFAWLLRRSIDA